MVSQAFDSSDTQYSVITIVYRRSGMPTVVRHYKEAYIVPILIAIGLASRESGAGKAKFYQQELEGYMEERRGTQP